MKIKFEEWEELQKLKDENIKSLDVVDQTREKARNWFGKIVGYHPAPKDLRNFLFVTVEFPIIGKVTHSFVTDIILLVTTEGIDKMIYPAEDTIITFVPLGDAKDTDGVTRNYAVVETLGYNSGTPELREK